MFGRISKLILVFLSYKICQNVQSTRGVYDPSEYVCQSWHKMEADFFQARSLVGFLTMSPAPLEASMGRCQRPVTLFLEMSLFFRSRYDRVKWAKLYFRDVVCWERATLFFQSTVTLFFVCVTIPQLPAVAQKADLDLDQPRPRCSLLSTTFVLKRRLVDTVFSFA
jgi:hypothetical protein